MHVWFPRPFLCLQLSAGRILFQAFFRGTCAVAAQSRPHSGLSMMWDLCDAVTSPQMPLKSKDAPGARHAWHPIQAPFLAGGLPHHLVWCGVRQRGLARILFVYAPHRRRVELLLLHAGRDPSGTGAWLQPRPLLARHHHVRLSNPKVPPILTPQCLTWMMPSGCWACCRTFVVM